MLFLQDTCLHSVQFIAHLTNQQVAHEILGLQILSLLLETPTDESVEVKILQKYVNLFHNLQCQKK